MCKQGFPSEDQQRCESFRDVGARDLENIRENCLWGWFEKESSLRCWRCKEGYAADKESRRCKESALTGCLTEVTVEGQIVCDLCDVFNGWVAEMGGNGCVKPKEFESM